MNALDQAQLAQFNRDGFYIARNFYDAEEIGLLGQAARADNALDERSFDRDDGEGGRVRLTVWNQPGDNVYGMYARGRRIVDSMEAILGGEVYHYHSKMILKDPRDGGAWTWHQDYGYWYFNGCLYPLMASVAIAVDAATRENGCMQVLKGSHHMGRVEHVLRGEQTGADTERVEEAKKRLELVYCEMEPGDALFFHSNLLHRSDQNKSEKARWSLICCYNAARNDPYKTAQHPNYTPLHKVEDAAIKEVGMRRFAAEDEVAWLDPDYAMKKRREELEANK
jgi:ectoine hydroxylase